MNDVSPETVAADEVFRDPAVIKSYTGADHA